MDVELGGVTSSTSNGQTPAARGYNPADRIWSIYCDLTEKHDMALLARWREEMNGILIFAGLFSGVITGFLLQGYKLLQPDPAALTISALSHISQQLATTSNGSVTAVSAWFPPTRFRASPISVSANFFWFLSLWFSVSTALLATLVKQWLLRSSQTVERPSDFHKRAKVRAYLYKGIRNFATPYIVTFVAPGLIHLSLLLFFTGVVIFLYPINKAIAFTILGFLSLSTILYYMFALVPIIRSNCPYQSPLTAAFMWAWMFTHLCISIIFSLQNKAAERFIARLHPESDIFMSKVEADALHPSRTSQLGIYAMGWMFNRLTDDHELEMLIEGISMSLGPGNPSGLDALFRNNSNTILTRILRLLGTCKYHEPWKRQRRATACIRAMWSILLTLSYAEGPLQNQSLRPPMQDIIEAMMGYANDDAGAVAYYARCAIAAVLCHAFREQERFTILNQDEVIPVLELCIKMSQYRGYSATLWVDNRELFKRMGSISGLKGVYVLALADYIAALTESPFIPDEVYRFSDLVLPNDLDIPYTDHRLKKLYVERMREGVQDRPDNQWKVPPIVIERSLPLFNVLADDCELIDEARKVVRIVLDRFPHHGVAQGVWNALNQIRVDGMGSNSGWGNLGLGTSTSLHFRGFGFNVDNGGNPGTSAGMPSQGLGISPGYHGNSGAYPGRNV